MIFLWLSPLFIAANIFYIFEISKWLKAIDRAISSNRPHKTAHAILKFIRIMYDVLWSIASLSIYIAFLIPNVPKESAPFLYNLKRIFKLIGNYHLGVFIYMGMALLVILLCRLIEIIICHNHKISIDKTSDRFNIRRAAIGMVYVSFVVFITLYGVHKAGDIKTNRYDVSLAGRKVAGSADEALGGAGNSASDVDLKIVMVADLHLGYNIGCRQMDKMVKLINAEKPDIVLIAGDIFDNEFEALDAPEKLAGILSSIESKYGTYAVYGNHDVSEKIIGGFTFNWKDPAKGSSNEMDDFIDKCGITLLMDEYVLIDDSFYIYGRPDYEKPGKSVVTRKSPAQVTEGLDPSKPVIVIDHEPRELSELADAGVDLDLCGHTHDGQFFPMNLTSRYFTWENSAGLLVKRNMTNIVTSGVGLFGPNIRIGTQAEICAIEVRFK